MQSVISQTLLLTRWVIVSDGSTDKTDEIVKDYTARYEWMELVRMPDHRDRQFASKVTCFNAGYDRVKHLEFEIIGNLDADISFERDYFEFLLEKFLRIPELGVAGTPFVENGYSSASDSFEGERHVAGGVQLFRRRCFEEIGGYVPNKAGGIDWIAVTTSRMMGWKTQSFREKCFFHHRTLGTGGRGQMSGLFSYGEKDYYLGNHPLWEVFRVCYRTFKNPYIIGGLATLLGYLLACIKRTERPVSRQLMRFHRKEEMEKLRLILKGAWKLRGIDKFNLKSK